MRICLLSHQFLPDNNAGVEVYVHRMARALLSAGHEVLVYTTRKDLTRREGEVLDEEWEGVPVRRIVRNLFHRDFSNTFRDPVAEDGFEHAVLRDWRPDLVHAHHLIHHSIGVPARAREAGVPVLMTLHDYWLECPRMGRLLRWDDGICETVDLDRCSQCMQTFDWRNPPRLQAVASSLRGLRRTTGLDLQRPLQKLFRTLRLRGKGEQVPSPDPELRGVLVHRERAMREDLVPAVERFLCPSRFLHDRMRDFGIPAKQLFHLPYSVPRPPSSWQRIPRNGAARLSFCGSVLPHKGPHVLLEAFSILREQRGAKDTTLEIHGGWASNPTYGERVRARGAELGVPVTGGYGPDQIDGLLARSDALVVPSLWFENQPITILDARVRGIPCLVSDCGGMVELVADPALRFRPGDPVDLARAMAAFLEGTGGAEEYMPPTPEEDLENTLEHYAAVVR